MSEAGMEYYQDYPIERIKRGIDGLHSLVHLMEVLDCSKDDSVSNIHVILDIVADDLSEAEQAIRGKLSDT